MHSHKQSYRPRIGIFGGAFNPIHNGHIQVAATAVEQLQLQQLIFVPTGKPPHKSTADILEADIRLTLLKLALKDQPQYTISTFEIERDTLSYTIETVRHLQSRQADETEWFLILGSDCIAKLPQWVGYQELSERVQFVNLPRAGAGQCTPELPNSGLITLNMTELDISSTAIRLCSQRRESISGLAPVDVTDYIERHRLYHSAAAV